MSSIFRRCGLAYVVVLAGGLVGCGGSSALPVPSERLAGKWQGHMIVYDDAVQGKLTAEAIAELAQKQFGLEFAPDGTMVTSGVLDGQAYSSPGNWEAVKQEGELLTIKSVEQGREPQDVNIEFDGTDTFYIPVQTNVAELGAMKFTRLR
ncbi:MAG: hypothetical protein WD872_04045 [Pirellulaceae bacterium]